MVANAAAVLVEGASAMAVLLMALASIAADAFVVRVFRQLSLIHC